ncbi:hypothetical protein EYF80_005778 [Liparis tanakae]|uniref:Uncharacterized protein n=1 Tax=Liparis tanakae TaxID=230148 RepID=A0A4Z2J1M3_9TELE|nr:hypothetical protein EYF80_005778 [Liparis tanakae]
MNRTFLNPLRIIPRGPGNSLHWKVSFRSQLARGVPEDNPRGREGTHPTAIDETGEVPLHTCGPNPPCVYFERLA